MYNQLEIEFAPRTGTVIELLIPYSPVPEWDIGYWSVSDNCFRFDGDDGPNDIQPVGWRPYGPE